MENILPVPGCTLRRRMIEIGDVRLSVLEKGAGPAVVFVHGSVTTSELFRHTLELFPQRYRALAVDLRGYGHSDKPDSGYTIRQFSDDLRSLFDALDIDKATLVGVSMGGFVAQRFALDYQDRLAGLVLCATSDGELAPELLGTGDPADIVKGVGWRLFSKRMITGAFPATADQGIVDELIAQIESWNEAVIIGVSRSVKEFNTRDLLQDLDLPTLIMAGTEDRQLPLSFSRRLQQQIKNSRLEVFEGIGHFMMAEAPARFSGSLDAFLSDIYGDRKSVVDYI